MGNFLNSKLLDFNLKAEEIWKNSQAFRENTVHAEAVRAVLENQTARFEEITSNGSLQVKVTWISTCGMETEDLSFTCEIDGQESESRAVNYHLNMKQQTSFKVVDDIVRTNMYSSEEIIARNLYDAKARLDNWLGKQIITELSINKGINLFPAPFTYDEALKTTKVEEGKLNRKIVANWIQQAIQNNMGDEPYFINGGSLFVDFLNAKFDGANGEGKGDHNRVNALNMYIDQKNFIRSGVQDDTFMIAKDAVGLYTHNIYKNEIPLYLGHGVQKTVYRVKSDSFPDVYYDVQYSYKCVNENGIERYYHVFKLFYTGLFAVNPSGCYVSGPTNPTGIISYSSM